MQWSARALSSELARKTNGFMGRIGRLANGRRLLSAKAASPGSAGTPRLGTWRRSRLAQPIGRPQGSARRKAGSWRRARSRTAGSNCAVAASSVGSDRSRDAATSAAGVATGLEAGAHAPSAKNAKTDAVAALRILMNEAAILSSSLLKPAGPEFRPKLPKLPRNLKGRGLDRKSAKR